MPFNASWTSLHRWQTHSPDFSGGASSRRDNTTREFQRPRIAHVVVVVGAGGGAAMPKSHIPRRGLIRTWLLGNRPQRDSKHFEGEVYNGGVARREE